MKTLMFPVVWAFTLTLALPSHRPSSAQLHVCSDERLLQTHKCPHSAHALSAAQRHALDQVEAQTDEADSSSAGQTGGAAPDIVIN